MYHVSEREIVKVFFSYPLLPPGSTIFKSLILKELQKGAVSFILCSLEVHS